MRRRSVDDIHVGRLSNLKDDEEEEWRSVSAPRERVPTGRRLQVAPIQMLPGRTQRRLVSLGPEWMYGEPQQEGPGGSAELMAHDSTVVGVNQAHGQQAPPTDTVPIEFQGPGVAKQVRCYCIGREFDRSKLQDQILRRSSASSVHAYPEVLVSQFRLSGVSGSGEDRYGDIFYFDWGSVVFWGLDRSGEYHVLKEIAEPCLVGPMYPLHRRERDKLLVIYSTSPKTVVQNDTLALHHRFWKNLEVKLAVSFVLAQSTKLSVTEEQLRRMGRSLSYVPAHLAVSGEVPLSDTGVMRAVGQLYKQMTAVTLLGATLDFPDALSSAPLNVRELYKALYDYMEVAGRIDTVNERFGVLREMLELCRTLGQQAKYAMLESIIMWLVGVCVLLAIFQLFGLLGWRRLNGPSRLFN